MLVCAIVILKNRAYFRRVPEGFLKQELTEDQPCWGYLAVLAALVIVGAITVIALINCSNDPIRLWTALLRQNYRF